MPERIRKLRETIDELEGELSSLEKVDDDTRSMLEEALREIQEALHHDEAIEKQKQSFIDRLRDAAEKFEYSHPTLFGVVSRTIDALGQMGI